MNLAELNVRMNVLLVTGDRAQVLGTSDYEKTVWCATWTCWASRSWWIPMLGPPLTR